MKREAVPKKEKKPARVNTLPPENARPQPPQQTLPISSNNITGRNNPPGVNVVVPRCR